MMMMMIMWLTLTSSSLARKLDEVRCYSKTRKTTKRIRLEVHMQTKNMNKNMNENDVVVLRIWMMKTTT